MDKARKQQVISEFEQKKGDTGSPEVQVALLTERINQLTVHASANKHDFDTKRGILRMVIQRRRLLTYLSKENPDRYNKLIKSLGLRK